MKRDSFIFYRDWVQVIDELQPMDRLKMYDAICDYALDGEEPSDLNQVEKIAFTFISGYLDRALKKYNAKCQRNKEIAQYHQSLKDGRWQRRRLEIMERDGFKCCDCGTTDELNVHHIQYIAGRKPWEYDDEDLITLCEKCHKKRHK